MMKYHISQVDGKVIQAGEFDEVGRAGLYASRNLREYSVEESARIRVFAIRDETNLVVAFAFNNRVYRMDLL